MKKTNNSISLIRNIHDQRNTLNTQSSISTQSQDLMSTASKQNDNSTNRNIWTGNHQQQSKSSVPTFLNESQQNPQQKSSQTQSPSFQGNTKKLYNKINENNKKIQSYVAITSTPSQKKLIQNYQINESNTYSMQLQGDNQKIQGHLQNIRQPYMKINQQLKLDTQQDNNQDISQNEQRTQSQLFLKPKKTVQFNFQQHLAEDSQLKQSQNSQQIQEQIDFDEVISQSNNCDQLQINSETSVGNQTDSNQKISNVILRQGKRYTTTFIPNQQTVYSSQQSNALRSSAQMPDPISLKQCQSMQQINSAKPVKTEPGTENSVETLFQKEIIDYKKNQKINDVCNDILKKFFPEITQSKNQQKKIKQGSFEQMEKKRQQLQQLMIQLQIRKKTFAKFGFKSHEKEDNIYLKPIIDEFLDHEGKATMLVSDLWSNKSIIKYLGSSQLLRDKYLIIQMAMLKKKKGVLVEQQSKPVLMNRKEEKNLISKIYMHQQSVDNNQKNFQRMKTPMSQILIQDSNGLQDNEDQGLQQNQRKSFSQRQYKRTSTILSQQNINNTNFGNQTEAESTRVDYSHKISDLSTQEVLQQKNRKLNMLINDISRMHKQNSLEFLQIDNVISSLQKRIFANDNAKYTSMIH